MKIESFQAPTFIDYEGEIAAILFTPGCNFRCPYCHAQRIVFGKGILPEKDFFAYIDSKRHWLDAVVICGGEPTLQPDLYSFVSKIKKTGLKVKLDTNGSQPVILEELLKSGAIDYVAMDVKAPRTLYSYATGTTADTDAIAESIRIVSRFPGYEFRTTVAPFIPDASIPVLGKRFMTPEEVLELTQWIVDTTTSNQHRYYLQKFYPRPEQMLSNVLETAMPTPELLLSDILQKIKPILPHTRIRAA
ncbi:anaerobic ribonucleoside-triphosphate reductase activating protein [bacterium]|nr:anaerobic ribonucleoside-triphosphate reductase activating protein [bacterium]MCP5461743.1 anaerobic ribonucleoside-triphosphate reductase activating protein [bacterium]